MRRAQVLMIIICVVLAAGVAAAAYVLWPGKKAVVVVPEPTGQTPEQAMKYAASEDFEKLDAARKQEYFDAAVRHFESQKVWRLPRTELNDEERARLRKNAGPLFRKVVESRMDRYFELPPQEKTAYLDKKIDRMQQMRQGREERRREREKAETAKATADAKPDATGTAAGAKPDTSGGESRRGPGRRFDPQRMKKRLESTPPEKQARRAEFFKAMLARMEERGIEFPRPFGRRRPRPSNDAPAPAPKSEPETK